MAVAVLDDVELYYEVDGEGDWLILAPGGGGTHLTWWQQVYALRDRYRCLTFDARGLGQSTGVEHAPDGHRDLLALMDHLGIERAYLNGWSAGGTAVARVAQEHPERVHALVMTASVFGFPTAALNRWAAEMLERFAAGVTITDRVRPSEVAAADPRAHLRNTLVSQLNQRVRPTDASSYTDRFGAVYEALRDTPPGDYRDFSVPTLFVAAEHDELQVPWLVRETAAAVGAPIVEIPGAGHPVHVEKPGIYNAVIAAFFADAARRERSA